MPYQPKTLDTNSIESRPILDYISVVIPTLGRPILEESLYWIVSGSAWPSGLIVVDQGASQQVGAWMEALKSLGILAQHVPSSQRGRAAGVNRGLERVQTRFVAVTDDDCFVCEDWLKTMASHLRHNPGAIVTGRVEAASDGVLIVVDSPTPAVYYRPRLKFDSMSGGNMGTSTSVIKRVGLFDEDPCLRTAEDGEWSYRALRAGVPIVYAPDVVVRHFGWRDESKRTVQYRDYARSHGGFYGKYLRKGDWFIALRAAIHHLRALRHLVRGVVTRDREMALLGRAYFTGLLPGIIAGLRKG
jgi:cellulose synthase/poly-beta-1,6-N-acetylglucosamine synthase-like glycosyltransferase